MIQNMSQAVLLLILANVLFSMKGFRDQVFFEKYKFQINNILKGEKIRMISSGFLHVDWLHLGFNMYALYLFGDIVDARLGSIGFLFIYFGSLIVGSLYSLIYHKKELYYSAVGASGAVSGIVYSCIMLYPDMQLGLILIPIPIPGYIFGVAYLLYSIYGMKNRVGNIGHSAHLGGAVGGFAFTLLLYPQIFQENSLMISFLSFPILLLLIFGKKLNV
tara:strand:+ start:5337 stop:5990 length:654 start_codon:yes stop_codon:yes gene_type:complete